jgi:hypothetical protein
MSGARFPGSRRSGGATSARDAPAAVSRSWTYTWTMRISASAMWRSESQNTRVVGRESDPLSELVTGQRLTHGRERRSRVAAASRQTGGMPTVGAKRRHRIP